MDVEGQGLRVIVCGSRGWADTAAIRERLRLLPAGSVVVEGGAPGADRMAAIAAVELGLRAEEHRAEWERQGKAAGVIRNRKMLDWRRPGVGLLGRGEPGDGRHGAPRTGGWGGGRSAPRCRPCATSGR